MRSRPWRRMLFAVWLGAICSRAAICGEQEPKRPGRSAGDSFVSLFDGKTLAGWHAVPRDSASDWAVRDGAIVGRGSADRLSYLVWKDEHLTDFELKLRYRLPGKGNTGVEIRSQPDRSGKRPFEGYHADLGHVGIGPLCIPGSIGAEVANTMLNVQNRKAHVSLSVAAMALFGVVVCCNVAIGQSRRTPSHEEQVSDHLSRLGDPDPRVRDETAKALGVIASRVRNDAAVKSAIAVLIKGLSDKEGEVREESAEAPARIASAIRNKALLEPAVGPLRRTLADGAADTRQFAQQALESLGKPKGRATEAMKQSTIDLNRDRYLLLDSRIIESTNNAKLTLGAVRKDKNNPLFKEDKPWEPRFDNPYLSVIYDQEDRIYKCWYSIFIQASQESWIKAPREKRAWRNWTESRDRGFGVCYAVSKDGIHWKKPELGVVEFQGSKRNNLVLRAEHGAGVIKDLHESDPQKRYKAIHPFRGHMLVWFSPDGLRWKVQKLRGLDHGDTYNCVFWDPALRKYVLFTRHWGGTGAKNKRYGGRSGRYRMESRSESPDFINWSEAKVVLKGLNTDLQIHDMPVFRHAGVYVGLIGLFDTVASRQHVELAWSPDSIQWHRVCPGTPLIANSTTRTGLIVKAALDTNHYDLAIKVSDDELAQVRLTPHEFHGDWNYTIGPRRPR